MLHLLRSQLHVSQFIVFYIEIFVNYVFMILLQFLVNSLMVANEVSTVEGPLTPLLAFAFIAVVFMGSLQDFLAQFDKPKSA